MLATIFAAVLVAAAPVRVEVLDMDGAAAPAFELAISRALVAEGVAVIAGPPSACGAGCARVRVQQLDPSAYQVEVARLQDRREARLSLPAEASSFERAHSLALRARALLDDLPDEARRPLRKKSVPAAAQAPAPAAPLAGPILPPVAPVSEPPARSAPPLVAPESKPAISPQALEPVANSPLPGPTRWLRIAVGSGVTAGAGRDDDLLAGGPSLWARAALGPVFAARLSAGYLFSREGTGKAGPYRAQLLPVGLVVSVAHPALPILRAGAGVELLRVAASGDRGEGSALLAGPLAEVEGRLPLRTFTLVLLARAALHHSHGIETDTDVLFHLPTVSIGTTLGVEFDLR